MNKIWLITQREFNTRVKKKSFIIMSILGPLLFAGFISTMVFLAGSKDTEVKRIAVIDSTSIFVNRIPETQSLKFDYLEHADLEKTKQGLATSPYFGILYIHPRITYSAGGAQFYSFQQPSMEVVQHISNALEKEIRDQKLKAFKIDNIDNILKSVETHVPLQTIKMSESGEEKRSNTTLAMIVAYIGSFLIYMFILGYGVQVMRGVIEEKSNRIVEVIISSVKPFQLMMGKVLGVALAAITQFAIWIALSLIFVLIAKSTFLPDLTPANIAPPQNLMESTQAIQQAQVATPAPQANAELIEIFAAFDYIHFGVMIASFLFFFIGGYLLYSSLFAAVGSAVDNDTDTQQFVLPVTLPLILGLLVMIRAFQYPDDPIAFWFSMIPFTSPIVMMARIPFGVPIEQVILSMSILVITFIGTIWFAGKIYRTGILMYGKKVNLKEMMKWLRYKN
ncbi:MAG TPA: ABC transporter permease [Bacteroidales bacterium]|nr:ABC transporter permease [Bacteroidales bacterium]